MKEGGGEASRDGDCGWKGGEEKAPQFLQHGTTTMARSTNMLDEHEERKEEKWLLLHAPLLIIMDTRAFVNDTTHDVVYYE